MASRWKRVVLVGLGLAVLLALAYGLKRAGLEDADKWASVLALFVALIGLAAGFSRRRESSASAEAAFKTVLTLTEDELDSRRDRFNQRDIYDGPCLILSRHSGLALDAKFDSAAGGHTTLWPAHAAPWQQWRIRRSGDFNVEIVSEASGLLLTTMRAGGDWAEVWLDDKCASDWSSSWLLRPTEDRVAFVIENASSTHALDSGWKLEDHRSGDPHVWSTNWEPWQQWLVVRLPLR
jgi:hypothetical protein